MVAGPSPTVLKRYVALELRRMRETATYSRKDVAARLRCAESHITHLETMRNLPKAAELELLLEHYGAGDRIGAFHALVDAARKGKDWWRPFGDAAPKWLDLLLGMEAAAHRIDRYDAMLIPGLFQTPAYAAAVMRVGEPELADDEVNKRVELRLARQDVLYRQPSPPKVWCVLDESVLLRMAESSAVMVEQLAHLAKLTDLPTVTVQIMPLAEGLHPGMSGTFTVLSFPAEFVGDPGVAYTESRISGTYYEDLAEITRYRETLTRLQVQARRPEETPAILARRIEELS